MDDFFTADVVPCTAAANTELSTPPELTRDISAVSDMPDRAAQAVLNLRARIAARANMDERLIEVEQTLGNIQRQSMSLQTGQSDIEKIKDFCRKQNNTIMELKKSVGALEQVCKHLMDTQTEQQHQTELINQALIRLGED